MTRLQKQVLATMAVVMVIVLLSVGFMVALTINDRVQLDYQMQIDAQVNATKLQNENIDILHK